MNPVVSESDVSPLSDITVIDITQVAAGPFATMTLGDMGAEIIKIEAVGRGDRSRDNPPRPEYFDTLNRNKRSITLDLKTDEGQTIANSLIEDADVFIESMKPGRAEKFNLDQETVRSYNDGIIYCSINGFGSESPYENVPAYDMVIQAMSGIMSLNGEQDGPPLWSGLASGDIAAAMYTVQSVLLALYARERGVITGEWIEVPMLDAAISWIVPRAGHTFGYDEPFPRLGTQHAISAPFGVFECDTDRIVIAAGTDSLWEDLCVAIDRTDLLEREGFQTADRRVENVDELQEELESTLSDHSAEHWIPKLHDHQVPAGPIYDTKTVWQDKHVKQRGLHVEMERPGRDNADVIDHPVHFQEILSTPRSPPEELGESTEAILSELNYSPEEIKDLREMNIVD
jgi:crotonobetainyl-CoA:carnitine CoA-transferase CaiB-like acyl-CoA transferase